MIDAQKSGTHTPGRQGAGSLVGTIAVGLLVLGLTHVGTAAEGVVPPPIQAALTVRILEYDRALKSWAGEGLTIGIVAKDAGAGEAAEYRQSIAGRSVQGVPLKTAEHSYRGAEALTRWAERSGVRIVYLSSDLGAESAAVLSALGGRKVATLTLTRDQFQRGGTLGMVVKEGKPHILINLTASKAAGMDLEPKLLQLAEVVR